MQKQASHLSTGQVKPANKKVPATHGVVCSFPQDFFGYFGWPTVARTDDGILIAAASGLRNDHVCPFGKTVICISSDGGKSWTSPRIINDSPFDDRDAGVIPIGKKRVLLSWFTSDIRMYIDQKRLEQIAQQDALRAERWRQGLAWMKDETAAQWCGSWVRTSDDNGQTWDPAVRVAVSAPHGPIRLKNGNLLYLGKRFGASTREFYGDIGTITAITSADGGRSWTELGTVPICEKTSVKNYCEPHVVELPDGKLIGLIRFQNQETVKKVEESGFVSFSIMQTESNDGGQTWTSARPLGFHGSPPHVIRHSSGALVGVYGYRQKPFGEKAMISRDEGRTWVCDYILRDDSPDWDLGYPSSVELEDGSLFTVYYQKRESANEKCSLLWTRWRLEDTD